MKNYRIELLEKWEIVMTKTTEEMKSWIEKYNVTDKDGNKVDLRKAKGGCVVRANGKLLRIYTR